MKNESTDLIVKIYRDFIGKMQAYFGCTLNLSGR